MNDIIKEQRDVGADILNVITESLYDKPLVIFREYVQNSVDSFNKSRNFNNSKTFMINMWTEENDLYFLDNGDGINKEDFEQEMTRIARSKKNKIKDIGYKGIGRLSGLSYCDELWFINICDYETGDIQLYCISYIKFKELKKEEFYNELTFSDLISSIGNISTDSAKVDKVKEKLEQNKEFLNGRKKGFLVILNNINKLLIKIIEDEEKILDELGWLLPVKFKDELLRDESNVRDLFNDLAHDNDKKINNLIPAQSYDIFFDKNRIERPIKEDMLRDYTLKKYFDYGIGFFSFCINNISIDNNNAFTGIKVYIDNILLCDENELIPMLKQYGYTKYTVNELIQTVKGIGALIYITDKVSISANARRTFIEVNDEDAMNFLEKISCFIQEIYDTRYALSRYKSEKNKIGINQEKLSKLRKAANDALSRLSDENISGFTEKDDIEIEFQELNEIDQKKQVKKYITKNLNAKTNEYLVDKVDFNNFSDVCAAYADFLKWLKSKI